MQVAGDGAFMTTKIFGRDEYHIVYPEANGEMGSILELVVDITTKVGYVPAHAKGWK